MDPTWKAIYEKFLDLPKPQQNLQLQNITKLLEGHSTVVDISEPTVDTVSRSRGRPVGSQNKPKNVTSTKRDPSGFEYVEGTRATRSRGRPVCSINKPKEEKIANPKEEKEARIAKKTKRNVDFSEFLKNAVSF